ncbi:hypothetical protein [Catenovulum agarivorans]|uniref:hypothetical protein n=1 Tax=Catenovulum agarivorans TaxID=1172192 RepID=UPI00037B11AC|nr:hypothetical protein [Catenovulum agarivorans]
MNINKQHLEINMVNKVKFLTGIFLISAVTACSTTKQLSNTFDANYTSKKAKLTFYSPNFSAHHMPPLMTAFAYADSYLISDFCGKNEKAIGKASVNRDNRTQETWLPAGKIIANIGYYAVGAGGLTGDSYYLFKVDPEVHYKITLTEARPFVTSYSVTIEAQKNNTPVAIELEQYENKKDICKKYS